MFKKYDLWDFCNQDPNSFSSGMKKKVLLIQALLNDPKILILIAFMLFLQIIFFALTLLISLFTTSKTLVAITIVIGVVASILTFSYSTINGMISSNYDSNVSQSAEMDDYFLHFNGWY